MSELFERWRATAAHNPSRRVIYVPGRGWTDAATIDALTCEKVKIWAGMPLSGQVVLMSVPNGPEWIAVFLALQKCGAIAAAADPSTPELLIEQLAKDIGAAWIYTSGALRRCTEVTSHKRHGLCLAKITSGSTGMPKAIFFSVSEMIADGEAVMEAMGIDRSDVNYAMIPFGHSYGLGNLVMPLIMRGCAVACSSSPLPRQALHDMREAGVTVCPSVPQFFRAMNQTELAHGDLGRLRLAISAGSALSPQVAEEFQTRHSIMLHNFLGSSETGGIAYDADGDSSVSGRSVGRPMQGVFITVVRGGRLLVSGPAVVSHGNRRRSPNGEAAFLLGDKGHLNDLGELVVTGRASALAKIGGRRVDPLEVEKLLMGIKGVTAAFVRVVHAAGTDRLAALVECDTNETAIRNHLSAQLPEWKVPRRIVVCHAIPRNERGKVGRAAVDLLLGLRSNGG